MKTLFTNAMEMGTARLKETAMEHPKLTIRILLTVVFTCVLFNTMTFAY